MRRLIYDYAGIKLSEHKRNMVYNRLVRRLRSYGQVAFAPYLDLVQSEGSAEREAFVNALTTNLTSFFREPHHFELLANGQARHAKAGVGRCASGAAAARPVRRPGRSPW